jgi:hypothetical protein
LRTGALTAGSSADLIAECRRWSSYPLADVEELEDEE